VAHLPRADGIIQANKQAFVKSMLKGTFAANSIDH
jgi:hypothetical protein